MAEQYTYVSDEGRSSDVPLGGGEEEDIGARRVHLVTLTLVDCLLLEGLDLKRLELLVEHLTQVHDHTLVDYTQSQA